jgi:HK97 family phage major capsid protein
MSTNQLKAQREPLITALREIRDAATAAGSLTDEQNTKATEIRGKLADLDRRIDLDTLVEEQERRMQGVALTTAAGGDQFEQLAGQVTLVDVIRAQVPGFESDKGVGRAREVSQELARRSGRAPQGIYFDMRLSGAKPEQRTYTTANPGAGPGSNLIQTTVSPNLIDRLRERLIVRQLGATVLSGLVGDLSIPRLKASATAYWVQEDNAVTESDPETDAVLLQPNHVGALTEISRNMLQQPSLDVTAMLEMDAAKLIGVAIDQAALNGAGSSGVPLGLLTSGSGITINAMGTNGGDPTWNAVIALIAAVDTANALQGDKLAFATNAKVVSKNRRTLRTSADTASTFIQEGPSQLAGYPLASSQSVPSTLTKGTSSGVCSALLFGAWDSLILGFWSELDVLVNPFSETAYTKGNVLVRTMATVDVELRHPAAFAAIKDLTTV